jgi:DNA-directed RNA polymerase alpha subunit
MKSESSSAHTNGISAEEPGVYLSDYNDKRSLPVGLLNISPRLVPCLRSKGVHTVGDLCEHSPGSLMAIRGVGVAGIVEIVCELTAMGLSLTADGRRPHKKTRSAQQGEIIPPVN